MKARIKDVPVGAGFVTLLTGREGDVLAHHEEFVGVMLKGDREARALHPMVMVETDEVAH